MGEVAILNQRARKPLVASEVWLLRAVQAQRIARMLSVADAAMLDEYAIECEAEAAIALLQRLSLKGCVVTADAIHCDRRTVETVKQRGGDYVIALKLSQRKLYATVAALIDVRSAKVSTPE